MTPTKRLGLMQRRVDQELLLLDTELDKIHQLNQTASFIWEQWDQVSDATEIARLLARDFDVEEDVALSDVSTMITRLRELNLLVV